jgi:serine/threonine protein kinase
MVDLDPHGDVRRDEVRICDFGLCERMESEQDDLILGFCGSPGFFAPEMITSGSYNGAFADMWSIGCIVLEMRVGQNEFHSTWLKPAYEPDSVNNPSLFWVRIVEAHRRIFELLLTSHCADFGDRAHSKSILARLLVFEPHARFSAAEVLCHEWCSPIMDTLATKPPVD